jgi:hypothetical protein
MKIKNNKKTFVHIGVIIDNDGYDIPLLCSIDEKKLYLEMMNWCKEYEQNMNNKNIPQFEWKYQIKVDNEYYFYIYKVELI